MTVAPRRKTITEQILDQQRWIAEHGGSLTGYIARYGHASDPDKHGDGGEAIFAADYAELQRLEKKAR